METETTEPVLTILPTEPEHVRALGHNLRDRDVAIAEKVGIPAHKALWRVYRKSLMCKTVFVENEIIAMWGLNGVFLGKVGKPWFVASPYVEDYPMKLGFCYRSAVKKMLKYFPILEDWVSVDDDKTKRLLSIIGFKFEEPVPIGKNKTMFMKATLER